MKMLSNLRLQHFQPLGLHQYHHQLLVPKGQFQLMRKPSWDSWAQNSSWKRTCFRTWMIEMWIMGLWTLALHIQKLKLLYIRTQCEALLPWLHQGKPFNSWSFTVTKIKYMLSVLNTEWHFCFWLSSRTLERGDSVFEDQSDSKKGKTAKTKKQKGPPKSKWKKSCPFYFCLVSLRFFNK